MSDLLHLTVQRTEGWANSRLSRISPRAVAGILAALGFVITLTVAAFLFLSDAQISGVGSISSPSVLRSTDRALDGKTPLETLYDIQRTQAFLDSVDQLGIERMEEIYAEKFKTHNHE